MRGDGQPTVLSERFKKGMAGFHYHLQRAAHPPERVLTMQLAYTILYVKDVPAALNHYVAAFGASILFLHDSHTYGELETGGTVLSFAALELAGFNDIDMQAADPAGPVQAVNITFVTDDVAAAYDRAVGHGAVGLSPPKAKPWGQVASYVRDLDGHLVEIATPLMERHGAAPRV
jgi:lactoylglutathione lyase